MAGSVVELSSLNITFGTKQVLRDFSLTIMPGQTLAVVGESGSGKSVAALMSMGLLDPAAKIEAAEAKLLGQDLSALNTKDWLALRGKDVAMVFQDPMTALHPSITIGRQLDEVLEQHTALSKPQRKKKILEALAEVEVP